VSKVRPEAWWSYYGQDYKGPNGLSLQRYPKNYGKWVKDKSDQDSWFSAKPIIVGSLSNILVGTELNLRQDVNFHVNELHFILYISGDREDSIGEYADSEWQRWILNYRT